jgi:hypothetical protein
VRWPSWSFSLRFGETIDLYDAAFRDSTLASNIELFHGFPECWPCGRSISASSPHERSDMRDRR